MRLRYTLEAAAELERVLAAIETESPQGARAVQTRLKAMVDLVTQHPLAGRRIGSRGMRRITASPYPYLIFYRIDGDYIVIHGVRHAARDPLTMLGQT